MVILLVILVIFGFATGQADTGAAGKWLAWGLVIVVIVWAFNNWDMMFGFGGGFDLRYFVDEYLSGLILIAVIFGGLYKVVNN